MIGQFGDAEPPSLENSARTRKIYEEDYSFHPIALEIEKRPISFDICIHSSLSKRFILSS
jgi:hypothetical protein